jgi:spermidine synthase
MKLKANREYLIFLYFFSSGFAALLYQVVWLKYLNLLFGSTTYATAAVLAACMFGLSLGSWLSVRIRSLYRSPLRSYGLMEMGVGVFALLFPLIYSGFHAPFRIIFNAVGPQTFWYNLLTFLIAFAVLAVPTSLMGATLPLLSESVVREGQISQRIGYLYAVNTAGAVMGIIFSAFVLIPSLGLHATISVGVVINLTIGLVCYITGKENTERLSTEAGIQSNRDRLLWLYAVSGLLALSYEVLWTRILVLHLGSSVYAYAIMLSVFLFGISAGSYVSGRWIAPRIPDAARAFALLQLGWGFSVLLQIVQFANLSDTLFRIASMFPSLTGPTHFVILFIATFQLLFIPTFLSGALFPVMVRGLCAKGYSIRNATSQSYTFNTIGGIAGSLAAAFLFIPVLGTQMSLLLMGACNLLIAVLALWQKPLGAIRTTNYVKALGILIVFAAGSIYIQKNLQILQKAGIFQMQGSERLIHLEEDSAATISVEIRNYFKERYNSLSINGVNVAGTSPNLISIQKLQGHIPAILRGPDSKKKVLHIGFGSGGTAYSISLYPDTQITVVELSRAVVRNADQYFRMVNHGIVHSGKLRIIYFDGRSFLQNTRENFDLILSDSIHPRYSGNGSLYTKDYYELVYSRLNQGGIHSQWIPLYSLTLKNLKEILRAFYEVFPETYVWYVNSTINPYIIVTGCKGTSGIQIDQMRKAFQHPEIAQDLRSVGIYNEYFLLKHFLLGKHKLEAFLADVDPHIDDRLTVEYESSRVQSRTNSWWLNFRSLLQQRERIDAYLSDKQNLDSTMYERFYASTSENLQGQLLFLESRRAEAKIYFEKAQKTNVDDRDPYEYTHFQF